MEFRGIAFVDGYIEKDTKDGGYVGELKVEGVDLSPVIGVYFKSQGEYWLWIHRDDITEYDDKAMTFTKRKAKPYVECYLRKTKERAVAYRGEFIFCHFVYHIYGIWDMNMKNKERLNLYVERAKTSEQKIINNINKSKKEFNYENSGRNGK